MSPARPSSDLRISLPVAAVVLGLDQLTKAWAVEALDDRNIDLFWTLRFNLTYNSGMAFGRAGGMGPIIGVVALLVVVGVLVSMRRTGSVAAAVAVGAVVGGALGNITDRLLRSGDGFLRGGVVDFIDLQWWPIFNVADIGVVVGGIALVVLSLWADRRAQQAARLAAAAGPAGAAGPVDAAGPVASDPEAVHAGAADAEVLEAEAVEDR